MFFGSGFPGAKEHFYAVFSLMNNKQHRYYPENLIPTKNGIVPHQQPQLHSKNIGGTLGNLLKNHACLIVLVTDPNPRLHRI